MTDDQNTPDQEPLVSPPSVQPPASSRSLPTWVSHDPFRRHRSDRRRPIYLRGLGVNSQARELCEQVSGQTVLAGMIVIETQPSDCTRTVTRSPDRRAVSPTHADGS
jgi:hypothetical protein